MPFYEFEGKAPTVDREAFIHPTAVLIGNIRISAGCYIGAGSVLRGDIGSIRIGKGSNIQENCVLHTFPDEAVTLHPETHIGHGSILHGCEICTHVLVGMGSIIADGVKINEQCLIGAGSFVPPDKEIPEKSVVIGSPAKVIKTISQEQLDRITYGLSIYQDLARRYMKAFKEVEP